ncbi:phosphoadenosine phosphosulfate reductase [Palleronia abyssalis]|nr:phosphoadenosine phosphosulfate reductase [Palleronia abyssalis]
MAEDDVDRPETVEDLDFALEDLAGKRGYHRQLDADHTATFLPRGGALIVSFEETDETLARATGLPVAFDFAEEKSWSVLHIAARRRTWFRGDAVFSFFDELSDDVLFDEYDRVIFFGAGTGGYAAAAYSVAAPGARVIAVSPFASADLARAGWDSRVRDTLEVQGAPRYAFAPEMIVAAEEAFILFDKTSLFEHVHASLFYGDNVTRLAVPGLGWIRGVPLERSLEGIGALHPLVQGFGLGALDRVGAYGLLRARYRHNPYLRALLDRTVERGGDRLTARLCQKVLSQGKAPAFRRRLREARARLEAEGTLPDWLSEA